ncbi:MAG: hypothetical protein RL207_949 [Bacteroidota bacterium]|jgi:carbamoyl-phosphate synthase large subunit
MENILITSAGRRVSLIQHFRSAINELNLKSKIFITDLNPELAPSFYFSDGVLDIKPTKTDDYTDDLLAKCLDNNVKIIIPTSDLELEKLSNAQPLFKSNGIDILTSESSLIKKCRDKRLTDELFQQLGINTIDKQKPSELKFPVFVKPYNGSLSKGIALYNNFNEIPPSRLKEDNLMWMNYLSPDSFSEFTVDCYFDKNGYLKCLVPRQRIEVRGGEISKGKTVGGEIYQKLVEKMSLLSGARGCITLQIFASFDQKQIFGIEINPRFGGGYPLSFHAGANYPLWILKEYFFNETLDFKDNWKRDRYMVRFDQEIIFDL